VSTAYDESPEERMLAEERLHAQGDANGDGAVDAADLAEWSNSFGEASQQIAAIPEPTTLALIGLIALSASRRSNQSTP
jgi:hypothetical protein